MTLNIKQRFAVVFVYIILIVGIGYYFSNSWEFIYDTSNKLNTLLIATGLSLVLSLYIAEPYFTKPADVIARWVAIFLFLKGLEDGNCFLLFDYWIIASGFFILSALILIFIHNKSKHENWQRKAVDLICTASRPDIIFTLLYFDVVISYFRFYPLEFPILIGFGFLLAINKPVVWIINFLWKFFSRPSALVDSSKYLGSVIGHESSDLYKVELSTENQFRQKHLSGELVYLENITNGVFGIVLSERILLGKKWVQILSLRDFNGDLISFELKSLKPLAGEKSIFSKSNAVYLVDKINLSAEIKQKIDNNNVKNKFERLIGCVWEGSTINKIRFNKLFTERLQNENGIGEGSIIQTQIAGQNVLYQIIDGKTDEEALEYKDTYGFTIGTAQKLGRYDIAVNELNTVKWLPEIYTPIFLLDAEDIEYDSKKFIGKLPNTNHGIPLKNPNELVTHNTAILGILGIGKSCLTFELLQKLIGASSVKVFCIDLTFQYSKELPKYIDGNLIQDDLSLVVRNEIKTAIKTGNSDNSDTWGNVASYRQILERELNAFIATDKRVCILNPDWHNVEKANAEYKITHNSPLTAAEKTRIISEQLFILAKTAGETQDARYLIVFEEAHSLVPEWNSVANDGDKNATNGTAKVILQGRKYGLGSFVITQRTANISKSILNQCNTIFALRVFDDTGKQFLENYIGSDYANLLPSLEERHCVAIGKALKLKQPVILQLNHKEDLIIKVGADTGTAVI